VSAPHPDYNPKQGETLTVRETFRDADGNPVDVSGAASLTFRLERPDGTLAVDDAATYDSVFGDGTGADGRVAYALSDTQTDTAGFHLGLFTYDSGAGDIQQYPTGEEYLLVTIERRLSDVADAEVDVGAGGTVVVTSTTTVSSPHAVEGEHGVDDSEFGVIE